MIKSKGMDKTMLLVIITLCFIGLIMVLSSTMFLAKETNSDNLFFFKKQLLFLFLGVVIFSFIVNLKKPVYKNSFVVYSVLFGAIILLTMVFFTGKINDSYRWIHIFGISIQPSEFAKIAVVLYLAYIFNQNGNDVNDLKKLAVWLFPVNIIAVLLVKEPDLGNFFLILMVTFAFLFFAGIRIKYLVVGSLSSIPLWVLVFYLNPDKFNRILALFNPEKYADSISYQMLQSIYAVGSGGIFGLGAGNSTQKLSFLPYAYSDFIFSIIGEEFGLMGATIVIALFLAFLVKGLKIAKFSDDRQTYMLVSGFTLMIFIQAIINISVSIGIMPTNGIPLPFISCGGSSLISSLIIAGIIVNVSKHRKMVFKND
jgi:cell division protein FtsW